jgi:hypothetical protein
VRVHVAEPLPRLRERIIEVLEGVGCEAVALGQAEVVLLWVDAQAEGWTATARAIVEESPVPIVTSAVSASANLRRPFDGAQARVALEAAILDPTEDSLRSFEASEGVVRSHSPGRPEYVSVEATSVDDALILEETSLPDDPTEPSAAHGHGSLEATSPGGTALARRLVAEVHAWLDAGSPPDLVVRIDQVLSREHSPG